MKIVRIPQLFAFVVCFAPLVFAEDPVTLPDAPSHVATDHGAQSPTSPTSSIAPKYAYVIKAGEQAQPLADGDKPLYALHELFTPSRPIAAVVAGGWSHIMGSSPNYGSNSTAFAQRVGAAAARQASQAFFTEGVYAPLFHDDPRYYVMGGGKPVGKRALYAATRVFVTRSNSGKNRLNLPLMAGYATAAGVNNLYYPEQDRNAGQTFYNFGASLVGAAVAFEISEFMGDALRAMHLKKN